MSNLESLLQKTKRLENEANERISKLQKSLNEETSSRISLENNVREVESRHRRAIQEIREEKENDIKQKDLQVGQLKSEIISLTNQLQELNVKSEYKSAEITTNKSSDEAASKFKINGSMHTKSAVFVAGESLLITVNKCHDMNLNIVAGSESSFVASERNTQQLVQKDEKIDYLLKQIQQIQVSDSIRFSCTNNPFSHYM